jgi:phosphoenolpyruvate-protein kinase (PTS system EI component)
VRATEAEDVVPESERLREQLEVLREEFRRRAKAWDESMQPMCGDFHREDVDIAQAHGALLEDELIVARLDAILAALERLSVEVRGGSR